MNYFNALPKHYWKINLLPEDVALIEPQAKERNKASTGMKWNSTTYDKSDSWNISGVAGEWAVSVVYNVERDLRTYYSTEELLQRKPDCDSFIEAKSNRFKEPFKNDLCVNEQQLNRPEMNDRAFVNVLTGWYPYWVVVQGWAWGHEIKNNGFKSSHNGTNHPIYVLKKELLKDPKSLFNEIKSRIKDSS